MEDERTVRIFVQQTMQPPVDTPAIISHHSVVVKSEELAKLLEGTDCYKHGRIIGGHIEESKMAAMYGSVRTSTMFWWKCSPILEVAAGCGWLTNQGLRNWTPG